MAVWGSFGMGRSIIFHGKGFGRRGIPGFRPGVAAGFQERYQLRGPVAALNVLIAEFPDQAFLFVGDGDQDG